MSFQRERWTPVAEKDRVTRSLSIRFPQEIQDELPSQAHSSSKSFTFEMSLLLSWYSVKEGEYCSSRVCEVHGLSWNLRASTLYMPSGGVSEMPQPFKVTGTKLAESQRSHSRDMVTCFLVKNSSHCLFPLPTQGQASFCPGRPCRDHDLAGTSYCSEHALDYPWA